MKFSWLAPLLVFGLVVFVHELGHFLAAKAVGIYAPVFSLGWGRRLWGIRRGETDYRLSMFPLGGFVRMASREDEAMSALEGGGNRGELDGAAPRGEPGIPWDESAMMPFGPKPVPEHRWFESKPLWARIFVLLAGVTMNFILAFLVYAAVPLTVGQLVRVNPVIGSVLPNSAAAAAGLQAGDSISTVNGAPVVTWGDLVDSVTPNAGKTVTLTVWRGGSPRTVSLVPGVAADTNPENGETRPIGRIGAANAQHEVRERLGLGASFAFAGSQVKRVTVSTFDVLGGLFSGRVSAKQLGGPIMIAQASVQTASRYGFEALLMLMALISINIAILNLLPVPILDGGQVLLNVFESLRGKPLSDRTRNGIQYVGLAAVLLLLVTTTFNDLARLGRTVFGG
jgi:regulator of sigma E protease